MPLRMPNNEKKNLTGNNPDVNQNSNLRQSENGKTTSKPIITFAASEPLYDIDDIVLSQATKDDIVTVINSRKNWDKVFIEWGLGEVLKQRKSLMVNLYGESGTGKTMAAHAIAKSVGKKIVCVNYADIESKYVGDTGKNLIALFDFASKNDYIIFFDEADALLSKRVTNMTHSTDVSVNQTKSVLLTQLNDYAGMVIFATNFISNFDVAFMRRIQYHIKFELPDEKMRQKLWEMYVPKKMPTCFDIKKIAHDYDRISGSDISTAVLRAALKAANNGDNAVPYAYFEEALQSILTSRYENTRTKDSVTVSKRAVNEEYALSQIEMSQDKAFAT